MALPIVFQHTDPGALTLSGTVGELITNVLDPCLICRAVYTAVTVTTTPGSFVDNTAAARSQRTAANAGTWLLFQGPTATTDGAYFGLTSRFTRVRLHFATPGVQATAVTVAWEYYNGTAWTALSVLMDETAGLTADGLVTWTLPTNWATVSVNGLTTYWVRLRFTAGTWTTNPLVQYATITGWTQVYGPSSNTVVYQQGGGPRSYLNLQDNGASNVGGGSPTARDARPNGVEVPRGINTTLGGVWPATWNTVCSWRKSNSADGTTRNWLLWADDQTLYYFVASGEGSGAWLGHVFGGFRSEVTQDPYANLIIGNNNETAGPLAAASVRLGVAATSSGDTTSGHYLQRNYAGSGSGIVCGVAPECQGYFASNTVFAGGLQFPNGANRGLYVSPIHVYESSIAAGGTHRGRMRGLWAFGHPIASLVDGDTFAGHGPYVGRTFLYVRGVFAPTTGAFALETSDTVDV
jgi:hypothetical protein